jgi:hypothetical protein
MWSKSVNWIQAAHMSLRQNDERRLDQTARPLSQNGMLNATITAAPSRVLVGRFAIRSQFSFVTPNSLTPSAERV